MKLVFVHGRAQGGRNAAEIQTQWLGGLKRGLQAAGLSIDPLPEIEVPFYGDRLDQLTAEAVNFTAEVVTRGQPPASDLDPVVAAIILQMAKRAGITPEDVFEEEKLAVVERGPTRWEWVQAIARRLERDVPWLRDLVIGKFTADVKAYIDFPHIQEAIHAIVAPAIAGGPCVIVSHSLGTVVAYWVLTSLPDADVRLLLTAGSPLGLDAIKDRLPHPLGIPPSVNRWLNVTDEKDVVALHAELNATTFLAGIENLTDIENGDEPHAIERYLSDPRTAKAIYDAMVG